MSRTSVCGCGRRAHPARPELFRAVFTGAFVGVARRYPSAWLELVT